MITHTLTVHPFTVNDVCFNRRAEYTFHLRGRSLRSFATTRIGISPMITYRESSKPPHIIVKASGSISGAEVRRALRPMRERLNTIEPGFVMMALYPNLVMFKSDAVESLFYYIARVFESDPGLFIMVDGNRSPHPGLRAFVEQLGQSDQVQFVETRDDAQPLINAYMRTQKLF